MKRKWFYERKSPARVLWIGLAFSLGVGGTVAARAPHGAGESFLQAPALVWGNEVDVSGTSFTVYTEWDMAADRRGNIFLSYMRTGGATMGGLQLARSVSRDGGATWSAPKRIQDMQADPEITLDADGNIYMMSTRHIIEKSRDEGATWERQSMPGLSGDFPTFAADAGTRWVATTARDPQNPFTKWGVVLKISKDSGEIVPPRLILEKRRPGDIVYAGGALYLAAGVFAEPGAFLKSTDRGQTWSIKSLPVTMGSRPQLAVDTVRGHVYLITSRGSSRSGQNDDQSVRSVTVLHSPDLGATWETPVTVNDSDNQPNDRASIAVDEEGIVHVGWMDRRNGSWQAWYARSTDFGRTFTPASLVSQHASPSMQLTLDYGHGIVVTSAGDVCFSYPAPRGDKTVIAVRCGRKAP